MSLALVTLPDGRPLALGDGPPFRCDRLVPLRGLDFDLPAEDPFVFGAGDEAHGYLDGARASWLEHPDYMDFLAPDSPCHDLKAVERDLYVHHWRPWWQRARTVLDVGCGIGRFAVPLVRRGVDVIGVDADLDSLRRLVWRAAGAPGRLDVRWSSVHTLPDVTVDVAIASEVLCYVPEVDAALAGVVARIRPGGALLLSLEARWGWAASPDAPRDRIVAALSGDGVVSVPGEGWVRTYTEQEVRALVARAGLDLVVLEATHYVTDGPLEQVGPESASLEELLTLEAACRQHPVWGPLHRIWTVVAVKPAR